MLDELKKVRDEALAAVEEAADRDALDQVRQAWLGRKGTITELLKSVGKRPPEQRRDFGQGTNQIKQAMQAAIEAREEELLQTASLFDRAPDLTLPGIPPTTGGLHPITQMSYDLNDAFRSMGFEVYAEHEISSELYAFDNLNFPPDHPARDTMDTYWIEGSETKSGAERLALRPHLTGGSVRYLQEHGAPARFVYPGRVYRNESTDARHERAFYQYEALIVEKHFPFASGQLFVQTILSEVFGRDVPIRMRAGFFPFVEPGFEIDMQCQVCHGKGCRVCKQVGWIEVMPGGVPHPNVLKAAGLDPEVWSGFYINIGLDRLVMMRYGIDDVRLMHSADLRFLEQYQ